MACETTIVSFSAKPSLKQMYFMHQHGTVLKAVSYIYCTVKYLCSDLIVILSFPAEKSPNPSLLCLCGSLAQLACVEPSRLQLWLTRMTASPPKDSEQLEIVQENRQLLQLLTTHIVRDNSQVGEGVCTVLLSTLIPMATDMLANSDGTGFPELMVIMATLASAGQGAGHLQLHRAAIDWLTRW